MLQKYLKNSKACSPVLPPQLMQANWIFRQKRKFVYIIAKFPSCILLCENKDMNYGAILRILYHFCARILWQIGCDRRWSRPCRTIVWKRTVNGNVNLALGPCLHQHLVFDVKTGLFKILQIWQASMTSFLRNLRVVAENSISYYDSVRGCEIFYSSHDILIHAVYFILHALYQLVKRLEHFYEIAGNCSVGHYGVIGLCVFYWNIDTWILQGILDTEIVLLITRYGYI